MSERLKSTSQVSNDEIIDELTKDLKSNLSTEEIGEDFVISPGTSAEDFPKASGDCPQASAPPNPIADDEDLDKDYSDKDPDDKEDSDSEIDEVSLKDAEVDLTDDQKEERKIIAEELKKVGNDAFKLGDYERSIEKYTEGLKTCPLQFTQQRSILYCNRSAAKMKLEKYAKAAKDCTKAIELDPTYLKAYIRRAQSYEATDKLDEAFADFKKILEMDPSHKEAQKAVVRLPPLIEVKNEKLKKEMLGKLKDLGNMILKPFGLSTENFQMEQDPETKGRAQSYEATDKLDEAFADFKKILEMDPSHKEAQKAVVRLPPLIEVKNEKLKKEMLGKLKDLGNMILKPFGLSTENFQMEQDPETKGYKINFKQ